MFHFFTKHNKTNISALLISFASLLLPIQSVVANEVSSDSGQTLVIGKISTNPKKHYGYLKPAAAYVVSQIADLGYTDSKVLMAKNAQQMLSYLRQGKVDWVTESPFPSMIFQQKVELDFIARKWKKGVAEYHSVFFTRKDSGIKQLDDLKGKVIAFQDRASSSAFYMPAYALISQGFKLVELNSFRDKPPADAIGYVFAKEEINMSTWVNKGIIDAGAYSNLDYETEDHNPTFFRQSFIRFYETNAIPSAIESVRSSLPDEVKNRIQTLLLDMHKDSSLNDVLFSYQRTKQFDAISETVQAELQAVKAIIKVVDETLD